MGNTLGGKKTAKVMKISGETLKLKTPTRAGSVVENHPGHVLLDSEAVKHYGVRAKPLEPQQELKPKRLYFLVELPKTMFQENHDHRATARRVRSGIQMSAKDRLESLMLARRSSSDLSIMKPQTQTQSMLVDAGAPVRVRMRLPKAEVERLMAKSKDGDEVAEKIFGLCLGSSATVSGGGVVAEHDVHSSSGHRGMVKQGVITESREKRVGFSPTSTEREIQLAAAF